MFGIFSGLAKVVLSPLSGIAEVIEDMSGANGEEAQGASIMSLGTTSVLKGTAKGIKKGVDDIMDS